MNSEEQKGYRRGPAMLLALLLSVLLGGPAAALPTAAPTDAKALHASKSAGALRIAERSADDEPADPFSASPALVGAIEIRLPSSKPASAAARAPAAVRGTAPLLPFHARAPPAA